MNIGFKFSRWKYCAFAATRVMTFDLGQLISAINIDIIFLCAHPVLARHSTQISRIVPSGHVRCELPFAKCHHLAGNKVRLMTKMPQPFLEYDKR